MVKARDFESSEEFLFVVVVGLDASTYGVSRTTLEREIPREEVTSIAILTEVNVQRDNRKCRDGEGTERYDM